MKPIRNYTGSVVPINKSDIDTDIIIPTEFLKRIERSGYGKHLMYYWRYDDEGNRITDFKLNQESYKDSSILLTRENFGCGSSRENAVWALYDYGFRVIIAPSFADIFKSNSSKNGLLLIELGESIIEELFSLEKSSPSFLLTVDLENQIITSDVRDPITFSIEPNTRNKFLQGLDDIELTMTVEQDILAYEEQRPIYLDPFHNHRRNSIC
ncbi:3-isopropylmalate dehydratase small subunit [Virgibacillus sp. NKC19-3]|uniref:3-isopropylmalate dehydratase small subunit n=1 Tax=Virgibacillus saliphilus TaxID=2831674 RepID=UPI001C9A9F36|nr:3-isopropylmalate dehydratase small subunit [Virgibacillus sp. NKC19-3]MBY7144303.1 3-isopropylmalate dehydratase small subunit [Virgibacillus sp. NKC19-3]